MNICYIRVEEPRLIRVNEPAWITAHEVDTTQADKLRNILGREYFVKRVVVYLSGNAWTLQKKVDRACKMLDEVKER